MTTEITLKNYRCFPDIKPAQFEIRDGLTAFIGVNNAGKSSLLKFFHEFRSLFQRNRLNQLVVMGNPLFSPAVSTTDTEALFCRTNDRRPSFELSTSVKLAGAETLLTLVFDGDRAGQAWRFRVLVNGKEIKEGPRGQAFSQQTKLRESLRVGPSASAACARDD